MRALAFLVMCVAAGTALSAVQDTVNLEWDPVDDSRVGRYEVHYGPASGDYGDPVSVPGTSAAVSGLEPGQTYWFAVRACEATGTNCSGFSNEVSETIPAEAPVAAYSADVVSGTVPLTVNFTDESAGSPNGWSWDFGDGASGSVQSPEHTYSVPGTYTVTLTVTGPGGSASEVKTGYIEALPSPPSAQFAANTRSGFAPLTVRFSDLSSGVVTACNWSFGDGGTSADATADHTYSKPGIYTVSLEAVGPGGTDTEVKAAYVEVKAPAPVAAFSADVLQGPAPLTVAFQNDSTGQVDLSSWDFGDGSSDGKTHPTHTYNEPGVYSVTLVVSNPSGSDTLARSAYIRVESAEIPMEVGEVSVNHQWQRVDFTNPFVEPPIVVAKPISNNGTAPATVRVSGVDSQGFWIRVQEWEYLDGPHMVEQVSFIAMERGYHQLPDGGWVEAGQVQSSGNSSYKAAVFSAPFGEAPVVFAAVTTTNHANAVVTRARKVSLNGFEVALQEQESNKQRHPSETVDYIAWEPSFGVVNGLRYEVGLTDAMVTHQPYSLLYKGVFDRAPLFLADMQTTDGTDPANLRWRNRNEVGLEVWVSEDQSKDSEMRHAPESVGYFVADEDE